MLRCPACSCEISDARRFCPECGTELDRQVAATLQEDDAQTLLQDGSAGSDRPDSSRGVERPSFSSSGSRSFDSLDNALFVPGTMLAGRYRVVGLLGRGGMGEVYRAEDLKLGQAVALKFLPERLAADGAMLARFHGEVRIARQVSHPNVCRVFDIGEVDGHHFLSMEYVDGENLSSLLQRIGRLPGDKAVEIGRQLCAGLAAAHDVGILHRDFKPANIMIDGRGKVRVTDFGLATLVEELRSEDVRSGTPAYMAPEQLAGNEVTLRSDIYSLGIVMYEMFTGKKAFDADTLTELLQLRQTTSTPTNPSLLVKDLDPLVERAILQCLEYDPERRPASAIQVAAALPGGDPLAAALAAGETPSPEMVAAAKKEGALAPSVAFMCLAAVLSGLLVMFFLSGKVMLHRQVPMEKPTAALADRAGDIIRGIGYAGTVTDQAYGFLTDGPYLQHVRESDSSPDRWATLGSNYSPGIYFWFRQSPRYLEPYNLRAVTANDPPPAVSGMAGVLLNMNGELSYFDGVPPQIDETQDPVAAPDWSGLFTAAGLREAEFTPTQSEWVPPHAYDTRAAWVGSYTEQPQTRIRIEAAAYRGKPVYFEVIQPWDKPLRQEPYALTKGIRQVQWSLVALFLVILLGAVLLARHNLRVGRGDRKGAFRLAVFVFVVGMLAWVTLAHHVPTLGEFSLFITQVAWSMMIAGILWVVYIALEPLVRRRWPYRIVSWTRLLAGDFGDPLVGRDLLIGAVFGIVFILSKYAEMLIPGWLGWPPDAPMAVSLAPLLGVRGTFGMFINQIVSSMVYPSAALFLLLLLSIILRREWLAVGGVWLFLTLVDGYAATTQVGWVFGAVNAALVVLLLTRYGLLPLIVAQFFLLTIYFYPITPEFTAWYAGAGLFGFGTCVALAIYGFSRSVAGLSVFRGGWLQE